MKVGKGNLFIRIIDGKLKSKNRLDAKKTSNSCSILKKSTTLVRALIIGCLLNKPPQIYNKFLFSKEGMTKF